jgi:energy-coupling factor transporter ATP-binding protein EcfA2
MLRPGRHLDTPPELIAIAEGISVTSHQVSEAIAALKMSGGTAIRQPLAAIGSPLADMDYHAVAEAYCESHPDLEMPAAGKDLPAQQVKSALLHYLAGQLSERPGTGPAVPRPSPALDPVVATADASAGRSRPPVEERADQTAGHSRPSTSWPGPYTAFKVLLDGPAEVPGLGFVDYAAALAEIIVHSRAEFAVGIFGSWGSGKTTLMRAIRQVLEADENVVTVWFTAWRYEKDQHLIVPLLDVLREALDNRTGPASGWARNAAAAVSRAGRAFLAGLTVSAGVLGIQAGFEPGKMIDAIRDSYDDPGPLSFYHAGFSMLRNAIRDLSADGTRRVVIFVDDLDRCLASNALDLLEAMKLFFDVEGCIFVVGLDQEIAEEAVAARYRMSGGATAQPALSGTDYVKKIFQVPFALPVINARQLPEYLNSVAENGSFGPNQRLDFEHNVRSHFRVLQAQDSVNLREIKRLINTYTLQLKMLSLRLRKSPDPNVVLALLCMNFRADWRTLYEQLATDPRLFQSAMREALDDDEWPAAVWLAGTRMALPLGFSEYLRGEAAALLTVTDLEAYVSAAESTSSADPWVLEARTMVSRLRRSVDALSAGELPPPEPARQIRSELDHLYRLLSTKRELAGRLRARRARLETTVSEIQHTTLKVLGAEGDISDAAINDWPGKVTPLLDALDADLRELHRSISIGAY